MRPRTSLAASLLLVTACASPPPTPVAPVSLPPAPTASAAPPSAVPAPTSVVAGGIPADAPLYGELGGVSALKASAEAALGSPALEVIVKAMAAETGMAEGVATRLLNSIVTVHVGGRGADDLAFSVTLKDGQVVRELRASGLLQDVGEYGTFGRKMKAKGNRDVFVWFEGPKLLVLGAEPTVGEIAAVVEGRKAGRADEKGDRAATTPHAYVSVAPDLLDANGEVKFKEPLTIAYGLWDAGIRGAFRTSVSLAGSTAGASPLSQRPFAIVGRLPRETASYIALSTAVPRGAQGAADFLSTLASAGGMEIGRQIKEADGVLRGAGVPLTDLLASLGGEGVLAAAVRPGITSREQLREGFAVLWLQQVTDTKAADRLIRFAREKLTGLQKKAKLRTEPGGFSADLLGVPIPRAKVRLSHGELFLGLGQADLIDRALVAIDKGKGTLKEEAAHTRAVSGLPTNAHARLWVDIGHVAALASAIGSPSQRAGLELWRNVQEGPNRVTSGVSVSAISEGDRIRLELDEVNGIGVMAALAFYGVRRYMGHSKAVEARNTVSAIALGAVAAWERETWAPNSNSTTVVHALCGTAVPVPSAVPRGRKYMASSQPGSDWHAGDPTSGWPCLRFELTTPQYYQYTYTVGGPYKGPARGGPDPGPNGFEVAAEGDLDGNGATSLFTIVGTVDPATGSVKLSPLFVDRELE